jgi:predicted aspartyl protease
MKGRFDEQGKLVFEIELIANDGMSVQVDALFDTGFTGWIALDKQDAESLGWTAIDTRMLQMAKGEARFDVYLEKVNIAEKEVEIEALGGDGVPEVLMGLTWLQTRRLVVDVSANVLTLGE